MSSAGLLKELNALRKGRGVFAAQIQVQVGSHLRALCCISERDDAASIRSSLIQRLGALAATLPTDLGLAASVALAIHPDARYPFLQNRIQWLAEKIDRDVRTVRRRMDEAIAQLAEAAVLDAPQAAQPAGSQPEGWYVEEFSAVLLLDGNAPRAIERRRIVAEQDGIKQIRLAMSLPRDPTDRSASRDLTAQVLYGGTLVGKEHTSDSQFRFVLDLPRTLKAGERHEYAMAFGVPAHQPMRTHYVYTSPRRCDLFDLRVRFDVDHLPEQVWRVSGVFYRAVDDDQPSDELLVPDGAGEVHLVFRGLLPGFGYGVQWRRPRAYELRHGGDLRATP